MTGYKTFGGVQIGPIASGGGDSLTAKIDRDFADLLNHLIHLARDLSAATDSALARLDHPQLRVHLIAMQKARDETIARLGECVVDLGHEPAKHGDIRSVIERGRVVIGQRKGDHGILAAMAANEATMRDACRDVLGHSRLPAPLADALRAALVIEERHMAAYRELLDMVPPLPEAGPEQPPAIKINYE